MKLEGRVYLLHFVVDDERARPLGKARHYVGFARRGRLLTRLDEHRRGRGARLTKLLMSVGGDFVLAMSWDGGLALERKMKRLGPKSLCPICAKEER